MGPECLSAEARAACVDQVNRALRRSSLLGLPASVLLALILGDSVTLTRRVIFVALVWGADLVAFFASGRYLRRRAHGVSIERPWLGPCSIGLIGFGWASLSVIGMPSAHHVELRSIYLLFVCATSATYVVGAAARRLYFYASQIPMLAPVTAAFVSSTDHTTRLLGFAVPLYFAVMAGLHHEVHSVVVSELQLRERNDKANAALVRQALQDDLTGLANRAAFLRALHEALSETRGSGALIGVLYIDIDWFKVVNDTLGHGTGDLLLVGVAERIRAVTPNRGLAARFGGDEFILLCSELHSHAEAVDVARRLSDALAAPFSIAGRSVNVSASIGVATNLQPTDNADSLLSNADAAQYQAKQKGRNRVEVFDRDLRDALVRRLDQEHDIRVALSDGQIVAWYQPIVDLHTGHIVGAEALARWHHPTRGLLDAFKFVPLAEETGLILDLDDQIMRNAVTTRASLPATSVGQDFRFWINISARHFSRAHPTARLSELLDRVGCDPMMIGIELTETAVLNDVDAAASEISAARALGVKVALDDFGVGHSSLTLLRSLPIDRVKIDRAFIANVNQNRRDYAIVRNVLTLAHDLGLDVVAEGVETPEHAHLLRELGCGYGQGWLWAKALRCDELLEQVRAVNTAPRLAVVSDNGRDTRRTGYGTEGR